MVLDVFDIASEPEHVVPQAVECPVLTTRRGHEVNLCDQILSPEDIVEKFADVVHVLVRDLDEDRTARRQQLARDEQPVAEVR